MKPLSSFSGSDQYEIHKHEQACMIWGDFGGTSTNCPKWSS
jgi:hypothetical protein